MVDVGANGPPEGLGSLNRGIAASTMSITVALSGEPTSSTTPTASVQVPHTGTKIRILAVTNLGLNMKIKVGPNA